MKRRNTLNRRNSSRLNKLKRRNSRFKKSLKNRKIRGGTKKRIYLGGGRDIAWNGIELSDILAQREDKDQMITNWCRLFCLSQTVVESGSSTRYTVYALIIIPTHPKKTESGCFIFFRMSDLYTGDGDTDSEYLPIWPGTKSVWKTISKSGYVSNRSVSDRRKQIVETFKVNIPNFDRYNAFLKAAETSWTVEVYKLSSHPNDVAKINRQLGIQESPQKRRDNPSSGKRHVAQPTTSTASRPRARESLDTRSPPLLAAKSRVFSRRSKEWEHQKQLMDYTKALKVSIGEKEAEKKGELDDDDMIKVNKQIDELVDSVFIYDYWLELLPKITLKQETEYNFVKAWTYIREKIDSSMVNKKNIYVYLQRFAFNAIDPLLRDSTHRAVGSTTVNSLETEVLAMAEKLIAGNTPHQVALSVITQNVHDTVENYDPKFDCSYVVIENNNTDGRDGPGSPIHIYEFDYEAAYNTGRDWANAKTITPIGILEGGHQQDKTPFDVLVVPMNTLLFFRVGDMGDHLEETKLSTAELIVMEKRLADLNYIFCKHMYHYVSFPDETKDPLLAWTNTPDFVVDKLWENLRDSHRITWP